MENTSKFPSLSFWQLIHFLAVFPCYSESVQKLHLLGTPCSDKQCGMQRTWSQSWVYSEQCESEQNQISLLP